MGFFTPFDKLVEGNMKLDSSIDIHWSSNKRLKKLEIFIKFLERKEKQVPKNQPLFKKIDELKNIYLDLLDSYETHDYKGKNALDTLNIDLINERANELKPLINQLKNIHSNLIKPKKLNKGNLVFLKPNKSYIYRITNINEKGCMICGLIHNKIGNLNFNKAIVNKLNNSWYFSDSDLELFSENDDWRDINLLRKKGYLIGRAEDYQYHTTQKLSLTLKKIKKIIKNSRNNMHRIPCTYGVLYINIVFRV